MAATQQAQIGFKVDLPQGSQFSDTSTEEALATADTLLAALGYEPDDPIEVRAFKAREAPETASNKPLQMTTTRCALATKYVQAKLAKWNKERGIYFVVNKGGRSDAQIHTYTAAFCEIDDLPIPAQHALFDRAPIRPCARVETRKSVHSYFFVEDCSEAQWREIQLRLIAFFKSDSSIKNPSRVMRLPGFNHVKYNHETKGLIYTAIRLVHLDRDRCYTAAELLETFPSVAPNPVKLESAPEDMQPPRLFAYAYDDRDAEQRRIQYGQDALATAVRKIYESIPPQDKAEGTRHKTRLAMGELIGGYVAGSLLDECSALAELESAALANTDNPRQAIKDIQDGFEHGKTTPITLEQKERERAEYFAQMRVAMNRPVRKPTTQTDVSETISSKSTVLARNLDREISEMADAFNFILARANCPPLVARYVLAVIGAIQEKTKEGKELLQFEANDFDLGLRMRHEDESPEDKEKNIREGAKLERLPVREYRVIYERRKVERIKKTAQRGRADCEAWQQATGYEFIIADLGGRRNGEDYPTIYSAPILQAVSEAVEAARLKRSYPNSPSNAIKMESKKALAMLEGTPLKRNRFRRPDQKPASVRARNHKAILTKLGKNIELTTRMQEDPSEYIETFFSDARSLLERMGFHVDFEHVLVHRKEEENMDKPQEQQEPALVREPAPADVELWDRICERARAPKKANLPMDKFVPVRNEPNHKIDQQDTAILTENDLQELNLQPIENQQIGDFTEIQNPWLESLLNQPSGRPEPEPMQAAEETNIPDQQVDAYLDSQTSWLEEKVADMPPESPISADNLTKPSEPETTRASVHFMLTRDQRQQLADLRYSRAEIDALPPIEATAIIESGKVRQRKNSPDSIVEEIEVAMPCRGELSSGRACEVKHRPGFLGRCPACNEVIDDRAWASWKWLRQQEWYITQDRGTACECEQEQKVEQAEREQLVEALTAVED